MRAVDHYILADRLAAEVAQQIADGRLHDDDADQIAVLLAHGQLHATLALAGATAMQAYSTADSSELEDWEAAAGGPG